MQFRSVAGGNCQAVYPAVRPPDPPEFPAAYPNSWLRVQRRGDRFTAFASTDGKAWKVYGVQTLKLPSVVHVGPALTSHNPQVLAKACFRNPEAITLQLRHEVPTEVDLAATSFKASVVLTPADALAIAGELLTVAATQVRAKG